MEEVIRMALPDISNKVDWIKKREDEFYKKHDELVDQLFEGKITDKEFYYKEKELEKEYNIYTYKKRVK